MKRPIGVNIFGYFEIFANLFAIFGAAFTIMIFQLAEKIPQFQNTFPELQFHNIIIFTIFFIISIFRIIAGFGILMLRSWGRTLIIIMIVIQMMFNISNVMINLILKTTELKFSTFLLMFFGLIYFGLIAWYFNRKSIRELYSKTQQDLTYHPS